MLLHTNGMAEPSQPLDINTLHNVHVVEELIQLTMSSSTQVPAVKLSFPFQLFVGTFLKETHSLSLFLSAIVVVFVVKKKITKSYAWWHF